MSWRDIDAEVATRTALVESERRLRVLAENVADVVVIGDDDGRIRWVTDSVTQHLGWRVEDIVDTPFVELVHHDDVSDVRAAQAGILRGENVRFRVRLRHRNDHFVWVDVMVKPQFDADGVPAGRIALWSVKHADFEAEERAQSTLDVLLQSEAEREEALEALASTEQRYRMLLENAGDILVYVKDGTVRWVSPAVTRLLGWDPEQWIGQDEAAFVHPGDQEQMTERHAHIGIGAPQTETLRIRDAAGVYHWAQSHGNVYRNSAGEPDGIVSSIRLIDDQMEEHLALERQADYDDLTGMLRRETMLREVAEVVGDQRVSGAVTVVLFIDCDNLKAINDAGGHLAGDALLRRVSETIRASVRGSDRVARMGGDEFLVLLVGLHDQTEAIVVAEAMCAKVADLSAGAMATSLSIGLALLRGGESAEALIARADAAMYEAKTSGGNRVMVAAGDEL